MSELAEQELQVFLENTYCKYNQYVYKLAWQYCDTKDQIDDLVQDIWVKLCDKAEKLKALSEAKLLAYISTTIRNTAISLARKQKNNLPLNAVNNISYNEAEILNAVLDRQIKTQYFRKIWPYVPQPTRELLERKYVLHESDAEIALTVNIRISSVRMYLSRARKEAFAILAEYKDMLF